MANTTWNATDLSATTLSGGNLTATSTGTGGYVRAVGTQPANAAGKFYWEVKPTTWGGANSGVGFCSSLRSAPSGAAPVEVCLVYKSGNIWVNNAASGSTLGTRAANDVIGVALDLGAQLAWFRVAPAGNWNGSGTANPATGAGGLSVAVVSNYDATPAMMWGASGDVVVGDFGDTAFVGSVPAGFTSGFPVGSLPTRVYTMWNPADRTAGIALSGNNLIAKNTSGANCGIRVVDRQVAGKYYWECTCNTLVNTTSSIGIASLSATLSVSPVSAVGTSGVAKATGLIYVDGATTGITLGALTAGAVVCVAMDCTGRLVWYRLGAAGNWNNSGAANPATGVGGVSVSGFGDGIPAVWLNSTNDQITANFGDTAFSGVVPAGFTAGWTVAAGGGSVTASQARAMVLA